MNRFILSTTLFLTLVTGCVAPKQDFAKGSPNELKANPKTKLSASSLIRNTEKHEVIVSVLDGGIDYNHKRFTKNLRLVSHPKYGHGLGLDILGADLWPSYKIINPEDGSEISVKVDSFEHGSHVSSLAVLGGKLNLPSGKRADISEKIGLLPVRVLPLADKEGADLDFFSEEYQVGQVKAFIDVLKQALDFSQESGAHIVNMSLGVDFSKITSEKIRNELIEMARQQFAKPAATAWSKMLLVVASGNESLELNEELMYFPASLKLPNLLTVGSLDDSQNVSDYSNTGKFVDVYIRGRDIKAVTPSSELVDGKCLSPNCEADNTTKLSGTSMAAPLVANLAAKIKILLPASTPAEIKAIIVNSSTLLLDAKGRKIKVVSFKRAIKIAEAMALANFKRAEENKAPTISEPKD